MNDLAADIQDLSRHIQGMTQEYAARSAALTTRRRMEAQVSSLEMQIADLEARFMIVWQCPIRRDAETGPAHWAWNAAEAACAALGLPPVGLRWFSLSELAGSEAFQMPKDDAAIAGRLRGFTLPKSAPGVVWLAQGNGTRLAHTVLHEVRHLWQQDSGFEGDPESDAEEWAMEAVRRLGL